jgi:hypothetical protein
MFNSRFERTGDLDGLQQAILRGEEAVVVSPLDHPDRVGRLIKTADRMRQLLNFQRFLLPPTANELMTAASMHPVVLINVSFIRCDAFLI